MEGAGVPTWFTYTDPYGYIVSIKGLSLTEILERKYMPKFRYAKPIEREIAYTWVARRRIEGVYYFGFELPRELPPEILKLPEPLRRDAVVLSRFKVDCIIDAPGEYIIVEIKDFLKSTALSQPILYERLFKKYLQPKKPCRKLLVAGQAVKEAVEAAIELNIDVDVLDIPVPRKPAEQLIYMKYA